MSRTELQRGRCNSATVCNGFGLPFICNDCVITLSAPGKHTATTMHLHLNPFNQPPRNILCASVSSPPLSRQRLPLSCCFPPPPHRHPPQRHPPRRSKTSCWF